MKYDFVVLGATGMQGRIISRDLLESGYSVLLCGRDKKRLAKLMKKYKKTAFEYVDLKDVDHAAKVIKKSGANVVACTAEGDWNLNALKAAMAANAHFIDLGSEIWMTKDQFKLHNALKKKNLIAITGCGSVPGVGNVMLRYAAAKMDKVHSIEVGFAWDSNIKKFVVPFSIQSISEEFLDPAPYVEGGKFKTAIPLESVRESFHKTIGKQSEFLTRHPEQYTFYKYYKNQGVKNIHFYGGFPKHSVDKIVAMIDLGLVSKKEINFRGTKIKPVDFTTEVLKDLKFPKGYKEYENLWVKLIGVKDGKKKEILMECIVPTLKGWEDAGCNIDTGMPASIMAQMIKTGAIEEYGSFSPEGVVPPKPFFKELRKGHMKVMENGRVIN
ncbi:MAG: saccharopine dehydrogenase C-terminal domain-containing protein [Patescibacteria group bacterium]